MKRYIKVFVLFVFLCMPLYANAYLLKVGNADITCTIDSNNSAECSIHESNSNFKYDIVPNEVMSYSPDVDGMIRKWFVNRQEMPKNMLQDYSYFIQNKGNPGDVVVGDVYACYYKDTFGNNKVTDLRLFPANASFSVSVSVEHMDSYNDLDAGLFYKRTHEEHDITTCIQYLHYSNLTLESNSNDCDGQIGTLSSKASGIIDNYTLNNCDTESNDTCQGIVNEMTQVKAEIYNFINSHQNDSSCTANLLEQLQRYVDILIEKIYNYTSRQPRHEWDGEPDTYEYNKECPLGEDVTADLAGVLRIMKILAPLLVLVFSAYEAIVAITNKEIEAESKKVFQRFVKRLIFAALLFIIPVLIDLLMQLLNVWDSSGHCTFDEVRASGSASEVVGPNTPGVSTDVTGVNPEVNTQVTGGSPSVQTQVTNNTKNVTTNQTGGSPTVKVDETKKTSQAVVIR